VRALSIFRALETTGQRAGDAPRWGEGGVRTGWETLFEVMDSCRGHALKGGGIASGPKQPRRDVCS